MPFADELIGPRTAETLIMTIAAVTPGAALPALRKAAAALVPLALRERSDLLRDALLADLPGDYASFAGTIRAAHSGHETFSGWLIWPVSCAVATKAVVDGTHAAFDDALELLAELTPRLTAEFAIRTLLDHDLDRALPAILVWTRHDDEHVRRLASEGTRPLLPWARRVPALLARPAATLPILNALYRDDSEYVRRSVANHLNDLSRIDPGLVVETATSWLANPDEHTDSLVRRGLRTMIKQGHPGALGLLGFISADIEADVPRLSATEIPFGGSVTFSARVTNTGTAPARIAIDYIVHHAKANGTQTGKTFKLTTVTLAAGEHIDIARTHSFRAITTRRYYPGQHAIELQVNGNRSGRSDFTVLPPTG